MSIEWSGRRQHGHRFYPSIPGFIEEIVSCERPLTGDVGDQAIEALDQAEFPILLQLHAYGKPDSARITASQDRKRLGD